MFRKNLFQNKKCSEKFRKILQSILPRKEVNLKDLQFYKSNEILSNKFYQIPQELFVSSLYKDKLNSDSKILYAFLLDRLSLSNKNNWIDEHKNIYLIFTRQEVQEKLGLSEKTATKAFKQLSDVNLIAEKRQGLGKPNLIYVAKIQYEDKGRNSDTENLQVLNSNFYGSGRVQNTIQEQEKLPTINTNNIKTNIINTNTHIYHKKKAYNLDDEKKRERTDDFWNSLYTNITYENSLMSPQEIALI